MSGLGDRTLLGDQSPTASRTGAVSVGRTIHAAAAVLLPVGLAIQVFLAGLGVFDSPASFVTHRDVGYTLSIVPLVLIVVGLVARVPRRLTFMALAIGLLFIGQSLLVAMRADAPAIAALHPVNGFLITVLALVLAKEAWTARSAT